MPLLPRAVVFPRGFHAHAEAGLASGQQGRISSQNTTVGSINYSNQPQVQHRESHLGLLNHGVCNISCSSIILNGNGWYGTCNIVFVKLKGTDRLCILSGPVINHRVLRCSYARAVRTGERRSPQSGYTTDGAYGGVGRFVIHVNECSFHVRKDLNRILKLLADIVRFP